MHLDLKNFLYKKVMQLEISFHNLYHFYKEKYQEDTFLEPEINNELNYSSAVQELHKNKSDVLIIEDLNNEIQSIETNNPSYIKISTAIKKRLFKKIKIYTINCNGNGNIKIYYNNGKPMEIKPIHGRSSETILKLGSLSGDQYDYWLKDDPYINKYVDCMYTYNTDVDNIKKHINICYNMGSECNFVYQKFDTDFIKNIEYISKYINDFTEYIAIVAKNAPKELKCTIIYEPKLIGSIYDSGDRNPDNMYIDLGHNKITLLQFISQMESICSSNGIGFVNVFDLDVYIKLIYQVTDIINFDKYLNIIKSKAQQVAEYLSFFKNKNTKYIAFNFNFKNVLLSNDEHLACLHFIKHILEKLKVQGILFGIPVGHVNSVQSVSKYTNKPYENHIGKPGDYQGTSTFFFFGGCAIFNEIKFRQNKFNDSSLSVNDFTICCDEHISLCNNFNIKYIMFGPTDVTNTRNVPLNSIGNKCTDHNYTICKISEFQELQNQ